jgi:leucyl aminopeptidase
MASKPIVSVPITAADLFHDRAGAQPIWLVGSDGALPGADVSVQRWLASLAFQPSAKRQILVPTSTGDLGGVVLGIGNGASGEPCGPSALLVGQLASTLPAHDYKLAPSSANATLAALAWGLGAYRFRRYRSDPAAAFPKLAWPDGVDRANVLAQIDAVWMGRDLINTPASDMGPDELEVAARTLAARHGANVSSIVGDDLLTKNFPLIHAVGRASDRAPRLIDITWGKPDAPKVTLVGKGICFDTGGLDIKPSSGMLLMKKDMGGAAVALTLASMIMSAKLPVRLRVLIPAAENSISGNAFRPSDVIRSRLGPTVEIGNTDAEGRLVLADALALADEEAPNHLFTFSTLTGAARVALGPDLPALFCDDHGLATRIMASGEAVGDPVWRMPFWTGYERTLDSEVADMNNVSESPFSGAIVAALFLRRYVTRAAHFAHLDLYGWRPVPRPLGPKGGEPHTARAIFATLQQEYTA